MPQRWATSTRRTELPRDWQHRRAQVRARAHGQCEHTDQRGNRCPTPGTDCHHAGDKHDHRIETLQWVCTHHHRVDTAQQSAQARAPLYASARHPAERHPGRDRPLHPHG